MSRCLYLYIYICLPKNYFPVVYFKFMKEKNTDDEDPESSPSSVLTAHMVSLRNVSLPQLWAKTNRIKIKSIQGTNCHSFHLTVVCLINNQVTAFSMLLHDRKTLMLCCMLHFESACFINTLLWLQVVRDMCVHGSMCMCAWREVRIRSAEILEKNTPFVKPLDNSGEVFNRKTTNKLLLS